MYPLCMADADIYSNKAYCLPNGSLLLSGALLSSSALLLQAWRALHVHHEIRYRHCASEAGLRLSVYPPTRAPGNSQLNYEQSACRSWAALPLCTMD